MKIGQTVKIKPLDQLRKITGLGFKRQVTLKSGLVFVPIMLCYAEMSGTITAIAKPGKDNQLTEDSYKIGEVDIYWSKELLIEQ